jgi:hypothetical protein
MAHNGRKSIANDEGEVWKGLAAGLIGGLVASWTMNEFQALWTRLAEGYEKPHGAQSMQETPEASRSQGDNNQRGSNGKSESEESENAAEKVASIVSRNLFGYELQKSEKEAGGKAVHYGFGLVTGGIYGALAEIVPEVAVGGGLPFGAMVWLTADEGVLPALGLSKGPTEYPLSTHAYSLAAHFVYGLTTEVVRGALRRAM